MLETRTLSAEPSLLSFRGALPEASGNGHGQRCCGGGSGWLLAHCSAQDPLVRQGDLLGNAGSLDITCIEASHDPIKSESRMDAKA